MINGTYGQMQQRIAYELGFRTDLMAVPAGFSELALTPIQAAIQTAIAINEQEHYWFDSFRYDPEFTTVQGQEFYTSSNIPILATVTNITSMWILIGNNRYPMTRRNEQIMIDNSTNPNNQGQPFDYSYFGQQIRLYPIPDGAYPISIECDMKVTTLSADTDSNIWTNYAEALIRTEAKIDLLTNVLKKPELVPAQQALLEKYKFALDSETTRREAVQPTPVYF